MMLCVIDLGGNQINVESIRREADNYQYNNKN